MLSSVSLSPAQTQRQGVIRHDFGGPEMCICSWGWDCVPWAEVPLVPTPFMSCPLTPPAAVLRPQERRTQPPQHMETTLWPSLRKPSVKPVPGDA